MTSVRKRLKFWFFILVGIGLTMLSSSINEPVMHSQDFSSFRAQSCFELFYEDDQPRTTMARRKEMRWSHYDFVSRFEERIGEIKNGHAKFLIKWIYPMHFGNDSQTATITSVRERAVPRALDAPAPPPSGTHWHVASRALKFVIQNYRERRIHWSEEFLKKLENIAKEYLDQSTYIIVEDGLGTREREIRGSLRLIKEKNGRLPIETYLGIEIDSGGALKVEPGNFAIDKSYSEEAWPEIMMQLWSGFSRELEPGRRNHYYTYADEYSLKLYAQLGFKPIPASKLKFENGVVMENGKILKDGIEWTPMEASQATLDGLLGLHVDRLMRRRQDPDKVETLLARREELNRVQHSQVERRLRGQGFFNGTPTRATLAIEPDARSIRLSLRLDEPADFLSIVGFLNPDSIPLTEGRIRASWVRDDQISYQNGVLRFESTSWPRHVTELQVTPDLSVITGLRVWSETSTGQRSNEIQLQF